MTRTRNHPTTSHPLLSTPVAAVPIILLLATLALAGCRGQDENAASSQTTVASIPKVDIHTHYTHPRDYLIPTLDEWNMRAVIVEVIPESERTRWEAMVSHRDQHPEHLLLCTSFIASGIDAPDFADGVVEQLQADIERGARLVKVWKNVGLVYKDEDGEFIQIDDPRFQPIWDFLASEGIPVLAHIGEPRAAWRPLDENGPHYHYYSTHPQYHFYNSDDVPSWEIVIAARDRWLAANPDLTVIGAHLGSLAHDTDAISARLDSFPNFYVDTAERFGDLAIQPSDKVSGFFEEYHDRILYGTDLGTGTQASELSAEELRQEEAEYLEERLRVHWEYLAGSDSVDFVRTGTPFRVTTAGLGLADDVLHDVYHRNAERLLGLTP